jgi:hypothetical protein
VRIDDRVFQIRVQDGQCMTSEGVDLDHAHVVVSTDMLSFDGLLTGRLRPARAISGGRIKVQGDPAALERLARMFAPPQPRTDRRKARTQSRAT